MRAAADVHRQAVVQLEDAIGFGVGVQDVLVAHSMLAGTGRDYRLGTHGSKLACDRYVCKRSTTSLWKAATAEADHRTLAGDPRSPRRSRRSVRHRHDHPSPPSELRVGRSSRLRTLLASGPPTQTKPRVLRTLPRHRPIRPEASAVARHRPVPVVVWGSATQIPAMMPGPLASRPLAGPRPSPGGSSVCPQPRTNLFRNRLENR